MSDTNFDDLFNGETPLVGEDADTSTDQHHEVQDMQEEQSEPVDTGEEVSAPAEQTAEPEEFDEDAELDRNPENPMVPHSAMSAFRHKWKDEKAARTAAEQKAADLEKQLQEYQQKTPEPGSEPDPFNDPKGYADFRFAQIEQQRINDKIALSGQFAVRTHGAELVAEAGAWASELTKSDPAFDKAVIAHPDPAEFVVQQFKAAQQQQEIARQFEDFQKDPEAMARRIAEEKGWFTAQPAVVETAIPTTSKTEKKLPKSLSEVPSANTSARATAADKKKDFDALFE